MTISWGVLLFAGLVVLYAIRSRRMKADERRLAQLVEARTAELLERTAQLQVANAALEQLATADSLTGLANRRRFDVFIQQEWQRANRTGLPISLLLIDVDHFKEFNDHHGHPAGDECLRQVAAVLRRAAHRVSDLGCRFGGDEFAVVLVDTDRAGALTVAEAIRTNVERIGMAHGRSPAGIVTVSVGVATRTDDDYATVGDLISACDQALYRVKERGRNRAQAAVETAV